MDGTGGRCVKLLNEVTWQRDRYYIIWYVCGILKVGIESRTVVTRGWKVKGRGINNLIGRSYIIARWDKLWYSTAQTCTMNIMYYVFQEKLLLWILNDFTIEIINI